MKPKLLIVTTFYNEDERLKVTLENMLLQESENFVHLLIDDGSTKKDSDILVRQYISRSKHPVIYEEHENVGINEVHMRAFQRTEEMGCTHFMWLDCGDCLDKKAVELMNSKITQMPDVWFHLDGYYISDHEKKRVKMSSKSYMHYLKKSDQFLPFCFSISTYGHFVIPYQIYSELNPCFHLVEGFYYDAQIIGALSLNHCTHHFIQHPLSFIQDDMHYSVTNMPGGSYSENVLKLANFVITEEDELHKISEITSGMNLISIRRLFSNQNYFENRKRVIALKEFYQKNGIKVTERYKWFVLCLVSLYYCC